MNETQQYLQGRNAKMSVIANCADVPPPPEVAQTYDLAPAPVALPVPVLERPPINPLDQINPPERPAVAPIVVEELPRAPEAVRATAPAQDDLDALDRDALKAMGVQMGIFGAGERRQAPGLRTAIREARKAVQAAGQKADSFAEVQAVRPPPSPVFVPPAAQAEFEAKMAAPTQAEIAASMRDGSAKFVSPPPVVTPEQAVEAIAASLPQPSLGPDYTMDDSRFQDGHAEGYAKAKADTALNLETFVSTLTPAQLGKLLKLAAKALGAQVVLSYGDDK
jgi:hypothetical protein